MYVHAAGAYLFANNTLVNGNQYGYQYVSVKGGSSYYCAAPIVSSVNQTRALYVSDLVHVNSSQAVQKLCIGECM